MGEVIGFIPRSERERVRLIREARAIYDSIFPSAASVTEQSEKARIGHGINAASAYGNSAVRS